MRALNGWRLRWLAFFLFGVGVESALSYQQPGRPGRTATEPGEVITKPDRSERWRDQIQVGQMAPEFTLPLLSAGEVPKSAPKGRATPGQERAVSLKDLRAQKPVVLIFGSVTCPPFRSQLDGVDQAYLDFRDQAEFLWVYVREAHPDSVLALVDENQQKKLMPIPQHAEFQSRASAASACQRSLKLKLPIAVDSMDNRVGQAYAGWPNRVVVVGTDGRVLHASAPSPGGTRADELRAWLSQHFPVRTKSP